jgi:hypothetical protein
VYVVLEWNQASHRPSVFGNEVYDSVDDAIEDCAGAREDAKARGRGERYTVHELDEVEDFDADEAEVAR